MTLAELLATLRDEFGRQVSEHPAVREQHGQTLTWLPNQPPQAVVHAEDTGQVRRIVELCAAHRVPIIAFGAGTSLEGQLNAPTGGISLDLSRMNRVLSIDVDDLTATVQPGVTREDLNRALREHGMFFPVDPGANATIGGMASTRASGTNAVRYGTMRENVLALEVVDAGAQVMRIGNRARKSSAGYDLTRLFVGAEGTLGVITELTVRIYPVPEEIAGGVCPFPTVGAAAEVVIRAAQLGIGLARIELLDELSVRACNAYSGLGLTEQVHLFVEFHGDAAIVRHEAARLAELIEQAGAGPLKWTTNTEERTALWKARHDAWWAIHALYPGRRGIPTDACVPISRLADCIAETQADVRDYGIHAPLIGHVGDGNFHLLIMLDGNDSDELERAKSVVDRLNRRAVAMGGTCTGEHGVGQGKAAYMELEHGLAVGLMRQVKKALDPHNLMNPGKIFNER